LAKIAKQAIQAAKDDAFNKEDAKTVIEISMEMDTSNPKTLKGMQKRLKEIYTRNFKALKGSQKAGNKQHEYTKDPSKDNIIDYPPPRKAITLGPRGGRRPLKA